uniref:Ig-like domain-containing protein n=1 Tax=Nothobranchius kadleci TaxID=1051664 RepID=A0A1A8BBE5_NOTKA
MDAITSLLILSSLTHLSVPATPTVTSYRASIEVVSKSLRIFSGENVQLKCVIPDIYFSTWKYLWFKDSMQLPQTEETLRISHAHVKSSGKFSCQGKRETAIGDIQTRPSLPVEVSVDGGWVILQTPPHPVVVGETLNMVCRLRKKFPIHETILYKNGVEVMRQNGSSLDLQVENVDLEDEGMYSCRASWDMEMRTYSVISAATPVKVVEFLSQPVLEIDAENNQIGVNKIKLICHVQYNARAPAPPINFYFYKNDHLLGTATSENHKVVRRDSGWYSCRAKVPQLGLFRWSEARSFGEVTGTLKPRSS